MDLDERTVRERCSETTFDRGRAYRSAGRVQHLDRFGPRLEARVRGSERYDVTVDLETSEITADCTCPDDRPGDCKHVVAVLLEAIEREPTDERERIDALIEDVPAEEVREFVDDALATNSHLRDRFLARFGDASRPVDAYRDEIEALFEEHAEDGSFIVTSIDFSHYFDIAHQYRERNRPVEAASIYRAIFEAIDDNMERIDAAYDHYGRAFQMALDRYVECVLAGDVDAAEREGYARVLAERIPRASPGHRERFQAAVDVLEP